MKLKKFLALATVTAVCGCSAAFSACQTAEHEHSWGEWQVTTPATCTQGGVETRVCADDPEHKETRATDPLGHDWGEWTLTTPASCESAAEQTRTCKHDSTHKETRAFGEATGHSWDEGTVTTPATCTSAGEKTFACTADGCEKTKTEPVSVDSSAHKWSEWTEKTPATCTESKVEERTCAHDSAHKETRKSGAPLGHKWDEGTVTTLPQVGVAGEKTFTCTVTGCGATKTEPVPALDHTHSYTGEWQKDASGHWKVCDGSDCNEKSMQAEHDWDEGAVTTPATCSAAGVKTFTCETCGFTKTEPVPADATAHKWGEWADKTAATCTAAKTQERVCEHNHEHKDTQTVGEPLGHAFGAWTLKTAPTANDAGTAEKTCTHDGCSEKHSAQLPPLNDAAYTKGEDTATCTEAGEMQYTLTLEEEQFSFAVATQAKGHSLLAMPAQQATCMDKGNKAYWVCEHCRQLFSDAEGKNEIDAPVETPIEPHALVHKDGKEASCTEDGFEEYYECEWCHVKFEDHEAQTVLAAPAVIPATGHEQNTLPVHNEAAKTFTWKCNVCGEDSEVIEYAGESGANGALGASNMTLDKNYYLHRTVSGTLESGKTLVFNSFPLTESGIYEIDVAYIDNHLYMPGTSSRTAVLVNNKFLLKNNVIQSEYVDNVLAVFDELDRLIKLKIKVDGTKIFTTDKLVFGLVATAEEGEEIGLLVSVKFKEIPILEYGENTVTVTEANASYDSSEQYTFIPEETKQYSITVPAGMTVCVGDNEFTATERKASLNFEGTEGTPVTIVFINGKTGEFTVTIGDGIPPVIFAGEEGSYTMSSYPDYNTGISVSVDGQVEEGDYTFTFEGGAGLGRCSFYFILNWDGTSTSGNEATGWYYISANNAFKVTIHCKAGDKLTFFNPSRGVGPSGVVITMTAAN